MIEITIDNRVHKVDTKLTIKRYQKIQQNPNKYVTPTEILALYLDIEPTELKELPVDQIRFVEKVITQHQKEPNTDIILTFEFDGVLYGMENDWGNMTWGQWADLEVYSQKDNIDNNIHMIMALLYRPIINMKGKDYKLEKFNSNTVPERAEIFKDIPIEYWFGASTFFLLMSTMFIKNTESSMKANLKVQQLIQMGMKLIPKWALPKRLQGSILNLPFNLHKKT